ncbi:MAG: hypothetical protein ACOC3V_03440 [bacterium]
MFQILSKLDDEFPNHAFGANKEGELFIDGQKVDIKWADISNSKINTILNEDVENEIYKKLKQKLLKNKYIKVVKD